MVKHTKNDAAISDQIDKEIKIGAARQAGRRAGRDRWIRCIPTIPTVPNMKYTFQDAFAEILPHNVPEYLLAEDADRASSSSPCRAGT